MEIDPHQEWETQNNFFDLVNKEFKFQLDAAATKENTKCGRFITPQTDALKCDTWISRSVRRVWLNPGFGDLGPWMERAYYEAQKHEEAIVVVMSIISSSANWWMDWAIKASEIRLIGGKRLQFIPAPGVKATSNPRDNCIVIFTHNSVKRKLFQLKRGPQHSRTVEPIDKPINIWTWDWQAGLQLENKVVEEEVEDVKEVWETLDANT